MGKESGNGSDEKTDQGKLRIEAAGDDYKQWQRQRIAGWKANLGQKKSASPSEHVLLFFRTPRAWRGNGIRLPALSVTGQARNVALRSEQADANSAAPEPRSQRVREMRAAT